MLIGSQTAIFLPPAKNKSHPLGWFFVFLWGEDENSAREFDYKRKAGGSMPVAESDERSECSATE